MTKRFLVPSALAVAVAMASAPASAQDRDTHFDGPYVSGFVGVGMQNNNGGDTVVFDTDGDGIFGDPVTLASPPAAPGTNAFGPGFCNGVARGDTRAAGCRGDKSKVEFGGRLGYDMRLSNNFVVGALFEVSTNRSKDRVAAFSATPANDSYSFQREIDHALSLRARAGFTPGGGALFYATGGGSYAKIDHAFSTTNATNSFTEIDDGDRVWGWQVGGGAEVMVTRNISLGLEYLYNRYDDDKYFVAVGPGTAAPTNPFLLTSGGTDMRPSSTNFDFHSVRAALSFQF